MLYARTNSIRRLNRTRSTRQDGNLAKKIARGIAERGKQNETDNERAVARRAKTRDYRRLVRAGS